MSTAVGFSMNCLRLRGLCYRGVVVMFALMLVSSAAYADTKSNEVLFQEGAKALAKGDYEAAIAVYETLADRGFNHPDVAYNRGIAYLGRVRAEKGRLGDFGRAAAGFEETLVARPDDEEAIRALELLRAEVARRSARKNGQEMEVRPSLDRIIVGLAPESVWAWAALVSSLVFAIGLVLRRTKAGAVHMAGTISTPIGLAGLLVFALLAGRARQVRMEFRPGVVIVTEARMLDEQGTALPGQESIPEAARVDILERRGLLTKVRHGQREGWTHGASLRELAIPRTQ